MTADVLLPAMAQVVAACAVGWVAGNEILYRSLARDGQLPAGIGGAERALVAVLGFVVYAVALMVLHIVTGGALFGLSWPVPLISAGVLFVGVRRRPLRMRVHWRNVAILGAALCLIFVLPVLRAGSGVRTGDIQWHLGWSEQVLAGEPVPTGPAPEYGRNAYPWGFHAVVALLVRLVPGSNPLIAHQALHLMFVGAVPLAAACLARRLDRRAGWTAAAACGLIGGFGWLSLERPDFIVSPSLARYGADLVVASPNSVYEIFPPALPRELALIVLAGAGVLMSISVARKHRGGAMLAGILVGCAGLISVPVYVLGLVWIVSAVVAMRSGAHLKLLVATLPAAIGVFALWAGPVVADYVRFDGFVSITPQLGVEWPLTTALWSWGLLLPLAAIGIASVIRQHRPEAHHLLAFAAGTALFLGLALARSRFGWDLAGNATMLHQGRVWPVAHLLGAAFGGVALIAIYRLVSARSRAVGALGVGAILAIGAVSPAAASVRLTELIQTFDAGYVYHRPDFDDEGFVRRAAGVLEARDVVRVEESDFLAFLLFSFSGARLARYDDDRTANNDLRIRYADLARRWDERMAGEGFVADYVAMPASNLPDGSIIVARGPFRAVEWVLIEEGE